MSASLVALFKCTATLRRRPDSDLEAFSSHWRTTHRQLALRLVAPGYMRGYVQNHRIEPPLASLEAAGDGAPELWIDSPEQMAQLGASPEYLEGARVDEPNFMSGEPCMMIGRETVLRETLDRRAAAALNKIMIFAPHGSAAVVSLDALCESLQSRNAPRRLSYERAAEVPASFGAPAYDWIVSAWWSEAAELDAAWEATAHAIGPALQAVQGMRIRELLVLLPQS